MKLIKEIRDSDTINEVIPNPKEKYSYRVAARTILINSTGKIAILEIKKHGYHKLPGGGLEEGEDIKQTLKREIKEEIGAEIEIIGEVGMIIEYKNKYNQKQTSYCYLAKIKNINVGTSLTKEEKEAGLTLRWVSIEDALKLFEEDSPKEYTARFIRLRDYTFLLEAEKLLKSIKIFEDC